MKRLAPTMMSLIAIRRAEENFITKKIGNPCLQADTVEMILW